MAPSPAPQALGALLSFAGAIAARRLNAEMKLKTLSVIESSVEENALTRQNRGFKLADFCRLRGRGVDSVLILLCV